ncbi:MAG: FAD-binding protein [Candidatus Hydrogenedentes bacterium]|nr:FAD-binding protein [Candidatus Hydrogenedentota bacterium]
MTTSELRNLASATDCEIRYDALSRQLYATDASIYRIEPYAVALPRSPRETARAIQVAIDKDIPIIPRGAGTGLAGGALGSGLVIDFSRYNRRIFDFDRERRRVRVEAGVVLDQLNAYLMPHGLHFGPDVATSSRATLGGMIANNSSGAHVPVYGTTCDHVLALEVALADGRIVTVGNGHDGLSDIHEAVGRLVEQHRDVIDDRMPEGLLKRWPGYGLDRWLRKRQDLTSVLSGSEGTLACILSAELSLSPLPSSKGLGAICFATVAEAMQATVELLQLRPAAIEHIDDVLFDQTKGQLQFKQARALLDLDARPCRSILLVEFFDDVDAPLHALEQKRLGLRTTVFTDESDMDHIWKLRKAGLSLLTGCKGDAKPTAGVEDAAIFPDKLPEYVAALQKIMDSLDLRASFYGHAASGLLHVRPVVDLHSAEDIAKFRAVADEVSALVKQFKGSISGEHGVGIARTEYLPEQIGPELMDLSAKIKALFDPGNRMNPGKIVPDGRFKIDTQLRQGPGSAIELPFTPFLAFAAKDESFLGNLEQCNGCGGCRKDVSTMCPTFIATGEEIMSTRGRANTIRAALEHRLNNPSDPFPAELDDALSNCLSCKACTSECPSNVNLALLKAELLHAKHAARGLPFRDRLLSRVDLLGAIGATVPRLANALLASGLSRALMESVMGLSAQRRLPAYALQRFDRWFAKRPPVPDAPRGEVLLWDDCFVRYNEPNIGIAAVTVLEAAGFAVRLPADRVCCGRPAFSTGRLDLAAELARENLRVLHKFGADTPIVFLEPSCYSMFFEDYRELRVEGAEEAAGRSFLFEEFLNTTLLDEPEALNFRTADESFAVHVHCHAKSLTDPRSAASLIEKMPGRRAALLDTGCCGMAGAFGALKEKYDLSLKVAEPLIAQLRALDAGTHIVANGTSCRSQIVHLHTASPLHIAEVVAAALEVPGG